MHLCQRLQMLVSEKRYLSVICPISEKAQAKLFPGKVQLWAILVQIFLTAIVLVYECAKSLDRLSCRISLKLPKFLWNFASGVLCNMLLVISPSNYVTRGETFFEGSGRLLLVICDMKCSAEVETCNYGYLCSCIFIIYISNHIARLSFSYTLSVQFPLKIEENYYKVLLYKIYHVGFKSCAIRLKRNNYHCSSL